MRWSGVEISLGVVVGSVVFVVDEETDWCTESNTVLSSRLDVDSVVLGSLSVSEASGRLVYTYSSGQITLSRSSPAQLNLDIFLGQFQSLSSASAFEG
jgi:hypothetical protein